MFSYCFALRAFRWNHLVLPKNSPIVPQPAQSMPQRNILQLHFQLRGVHSPFLLVDIIVQNSLNPSKKPGAERTACASFRMSCNKVVEVEIEDDAKDKRLGKKCCLDSELAASPMSSCEVPSLLALWLKTVPCCKATMRLSASLYFLQHNRRQQRRTLRNRLVLVVGLGQLDLVSEALV